MRSLRAGIAPALCAISFALAASAAPRHPDIASLGKNSRELFLTSMSWGDRYYDAQAKLCRMPPSPANAELRLPSYLMVRESTWYALGLLLRDGASDRARAAQILDVVLKAQYREPAKPWDGTFRRSPAEPEPGPEAVMWRGYDPNWREFVGTTFAVILTEYPDRVSPELRRRMIEAIDYAVAGEMKQERLAPTYTNISLMYGFLWGFAAVRGGRPEWTAQAEQWQKTVYDLYKQHDAFWEYNSPTYSGVDIFALALWRDYGFTSLMRQRGSEMEAGLWRATADLYNANLRNISGPYDRAYGMDMQSYVSVMGLWLRTVLDADHAPLTSFDPPVDHVADLWIAPLIVVLDTRIPPDAMAKFERFPGPHQVNRPIDDKRVATAWIGKTIIYGGEITGHSRDVDARSQFHPVTVQWQAPNGKIGWIQLTRCPPIDASADQSGIAISAVGDVSFRLSAPDLAARDISGEEWSLPSLSVRVKTDAKSFTAAQHVQFVDVVYKGMTRMTLTVVHSGE
ncbi:MAG: hypothetical protein WBC92_05040 [Terracidiphilus sp.]